MSCAYRYIIYFMLPALYVTICYAFYLAISFYVIYQQRALKIILKKEFIFDKISFNLFNNSLLLYYSILITYDIKIKFHRN